MRPKIVLMTLGLVVLAGSITAACGGAGTPTPAPAKPEQAATTAPSPASTASAASPEPTGPVVTMRSNYFLPEEPTFESGTEVAVYNESTEPHTFTIAKADIDVLVQGGETEQVALDMKPGTYMLVCRLHEEMETDLTITG
jgi:plastocyanin